MHREISHADTTFSHEPRLELHALLVLIGGLVAADLWPALVDWLGPWGTGLPVWPREVFGQRLALIAAVIGGARTLYGALESLLAGKIGADLAVAIAVLASILLREPLVAAEVLIIGLVGELLEDWTFRRTQSALEGLVKLAPKRCWRLKPDGTEERILVTDLKVGDRVAVKPGGKIPADGVILTGRSTLDTRVLTGESAPLEVGPGSQVLAGCVNHLGAITLEARRVAEHTVAGQVGKLTASALADKSAIERRADALARWFLPITLALALVTFLVAWWLEGRGAASRAELPPSNWQLMRRAAPPALAVLVVACPCALILATPAAIIAALGRLAGTGILLRRGEALERLAGVRAFCLDKTGTLTEGKFQLVRVATLAGMDEGSLLALAAGVESGSEHPLARAVTSAAALRGILPAAVDQIQASPGGGVAGLVDNRKVLLGSARFLEESGVLLDAARDLVQTADAAGETPVLVAVDGTLVGLFGLLDKARPSAAAAIAELRSLGIERFLMLTGDRPEVARRVALEVGLSTEEVRAGLLPAEKASLVAELEGPAGGCPVAMVGDGINDAPALARASAGLAVSHRGSGVDLAAEAGDAVLLGAPLEHLGLLVRLARETREVIGQNILWFALGANLVGMAITAWLWPWIAPAGWRNQSPLAAAIYHQLASVLVLVNSMRLLWFERPAPTLLTRMGAISEQVGRWAGQLTPGELLHHAGHHWKKILAGACAVALACWVWTGIHLVSSQEQGRVLRFGKLLEGPLEPGFHWRLPWPVERVARVMPGRSRSVTVGFRPEPKAGGGPGGNKVARTWASAHASEGILRQQEESLVITGDGYLVEILATVRFRILEGNPFQSLFELGEADKLVRVAAETVLRELAAEGAFSDLLTSRRGELEGRARQVLAGRLGSEVADLPGLEVEGVSLHDLHPPAEVVTSYHEVTRAMETRQQRQNQAQAATLRKRGEQVSRDEDLLARSFVESFIRVETAKAAGAAFITRLAARAAQPGLVDFRLFWDAVGAALAGREKLVVDSPAVPIRSALWLIPPELVKPMFQPQRGRNDPVGPREDVPGGRQP